MVAIKPSFLSLSLFAMAVSAFPTHYSASLSALPRDAGIAHIALDEHSNTVIAYRRDGTLYGRFATVPHDDNATEHLTKRAPSCTNLSIDEAKTIPGWNTIVQYAKDNWGNGKFNLVTNPSEFLDRPAQVCVDGEPVTVTRKSDPVCTTNNAVSDGKLVGTSGSVTLDVTSGFTNTATWTVTKSSSLGVSIKLGATFKIPEVLDIGAETTTSAEFTNTLSDSFSTSVSAQQRQSLTVEAADGQTCHVEFKTNTCNVQGVGKIRTVATGWIWFNFHSKTQGHFKWAVNMDEVLKNVDDRSSFTEFTGSMRGESSSEFRALCK